MTTHTGTETLYLDSILSEANQKEIIRQEFKYTYEKQAIADSTTFASKKIIQEVFNEF